MTKKGEKKESQASKSGNVSKNFEKNTVKKQTGKRSKKVGPVGKSEFLIMPLSLNDRKVLKK